MRQMQYNAPICMYVFQNFSGVGDDILGPTFRFSYWDPKSGPLPSKILAACLPHQLKQTIERWSRDNQNDGIVEYSMIFGLQPGFVLFRSCIAASFTSDLTADNGMFGVIYGKAMIVVANLLTLILTNVKRKKVIK